MTPERPNTHDLSRWQGPAWILALSTLWIAQPLYDLLGGVPDYFLVRGLGTSDVWLFGLLAFLLPPALLVGLAEAAGLLGTGPRRLAYRALAAALAALGVLLVLGLLDHARGAGRLPAWLHVLAALVAASTFHRLLRLDGTRHALRLLALLAPLAPLLFFLRADVRGELARPLVSPVPAAAATHDLKEQIPVVVLVLDELPLYTLLDPRGEIDAQLFPHLAELASVATWYRGATTPRVFTQHALPALVAGRTGGLVVPATARGYPANLLTLLRASHRVVSDEPITALDPGRPLAARGLRLRAMAGDAVLMLAHAALPPSCASSLPRPALRATIGEPTDPTERFDAFLRRLASEAGAAQAAGEPLLVFSHLLLPHHPWLRDETGRLYDAGDEILIAGIESPQIGAIHARWQDDWETVLDAYERHVLQTRHADRLVGRLLDLLRHKRLFDSALVVVAADHGIHFAPGESLRQHGDDNADSLEQVPLLVKLPAQRGGVVDDTPRSTLDVLPTILDVLGLDGSELDLAGSSLLGPPPRKARHRGEPPFKELRDRWLERRLAAGPDGFGPWHEQLAGRPLRIGGVPTRNWVADIERVERLENVAPDLPPPRRLAGRLLPRRAAALAELVETQGALPLGVGIDGRMVATTLSSQAREDDEDLMFSVLLPHGAVAPGEHQVVLYLLALDDDDRPLPPLPIPRAFQPRPFDATPATLRRGGATLVRLQGVDAAAEIFGWTPPADESGSEIVSVAVVHGGRRLVKAAWVDGEEALGFRYRFDGAPDGARLFRAVVPSASVDELRLVVRTGDGRFIELPVEITQESVFRVTGPFGLRFDARRPAPAFQNF